MPSYLCIRCADWSERMSRHCAFYRHSLVRFLLMRQPNDLKERRLPSLDRVCSNAIAVAGNDAGQSLHPLELFVEILKIYDNNLSCIVQNSGISFATRTYYQKLLRWYSILASCSVPYSSVSCRTSSVARSRSCSLLLPRPSSAAPQQHLRTSTSSRC